jgi:hypothetical protein
MSGLRVGASSVNINPPMGLRKGGFRLFGEPITSVDDDMDLTLNAQMKKSAETIL